MNYTVEIRHSVGVESLIKEHTLVSLIPHTF